MNVKLFGHRCLVELYKPTNTNSKIVIPDIAQNRDSHRLGIVRYLGDGRLKGREKGETRAPLVRVGDVVMFQLNQIMEATQTFVAEGKTCMHLLQEELIARLTGDEITVDNMEMLGDYVLLKHFMRKQPGSLLVLPENLVKQSAPEFVYFRCVKKGAQADLQFKEGDELVVNFGRLTPMFIVKRNLDGTSENHEYCYTRQDWVDGVVEDVAAPPA